MKRGTTVNTLAAPAGFLVAGQVLENWGVVLLFSVVAAGMTAMAIVFSSIVLRHREAEHAVAEPAVL